MVYFKQEIASVPIEKLRGLTPLELINKYQLVIYSKADIRVINEGLSLIQGIIEKNKTLIEKGKDDERN